MKSLATYSKQPMMPLHNRQVSKQLGKILSGDYSAEPKRDNIHVLYMLNIISMKIE